MNWFRCDEIRKNDNKRKKSSTHDDGQSQCKLKSLRQQDLEPSLNHLEPEKLDEENFLFAKDLERELLEFDKGRSNQNQIIPYSVCKNCFLVIPHQKKPFSTLQNQRKWKQWA